MDGLWLWTLLRGILSKFGIFKDMLDLLPRNIRSVSPQSRQVDRILTMMEVGDVCSQVFKSITENVNNVCFEIFHG